MTYIVIPFTVVLLLLLICILVSFAYNMAIYLYDISPLAALVTRIKERNRHAHTKHNK